VLAFIVEPIGGASTGALVPPAGYMARIREICDRYGVLLIHDEVMTGGGRTGKFFAAEHWGVGARHRRRVQGLRRGLRAARRDGGA
jgi:adenosylmethionine-8-amino-7-oxononanoate aminotransferase